MKHLTPNFEGKSRTFGHEKAQKAQEGKSRKKEEE